MSGVKSLEVAYLGVTDTDTTRDSYFSGDESRITMALFPFAALSAGRILFSVERVLDKEGGVSDVAVWTCSQQDASASPFTTIPLDGRSDIVGDARLVHSLPASTVGYATSAYVSPVYPLLDALQQPSRGVVVHFTLAMAALTTFQIYLLNSVRTFLSFSGQLTDATNNTGHCVAIAWD